MKKIILHLCADIGSDSWFYANDDEYEVIKIGKEIGVENFNPPENVYGVIANPVCTEFSFAKWANNKGDGDVEEGMFLVNHCLRIINQCNPKFWVIENPATGRLKEFLGAPKLTYQPYEYGSPWTKKTALWGEFNVPSKIHTWETVEKNPKLYVRPNRGKPSLAFLHKSAIYDIPEFLKFADLVHDDMSLRSLCSQTFAQQFFNVNR
jgi:hypothetical protein